MTDLEKVLVDSGDYSAAEAHEIQIELANRVLDGEDPEELLEEYGLEPDYVFDIL